MARHLSIQWHQLSHQDLLHQFRPHCRKCQACNIVLESRSEQSLSQKVLRLVLSHRAKLLTRRTTFSSLEVSSPLPTLKTPKFLKLVCLPQKSSTSCNSRTPFIIAILVASLSFTALPVTSTSSIPSPRILISTSVLPVPETDFLTVCSQRR